MFGANRDLNKKELLPLPFIELVLSSNEKETDFRYIVHAVQLMADTAFIAYEFDKFLTVKANGNDNKMTFKVKVSD